jgi:hypothetical protein
MLARRGLRPSCARSDLPFPADISGTAAERLGHYAFRLFLRGAIQRKNGFSPDEATGYVDGNRRASSPSRSSHWGRCGAIRATIVKGHVAVAEKLSALRTEEYFAERAARGNVSKALRIIKRAGIGKLPVPGDELPKNGVRRRR